MNKLSYALAFSLATGMVWAQGTCGDGLADSIAFNVVIRDFQPAHPDFENFDDRWRQISANPSAGYAPFSPQCYGKTNTPIDNPITTNIDERVYNMACEGGWTCGMQKPDGSFPQQALYGEFNVTGVGKVRGLKHEIMAQYPSAAQSWADSVWITRGMVQGELEKPNPKDAITWIPKKATELCHNTFFDQMWYKDDATWNRKIETAMWLKRVGCTKQYRIDSRDMPGGAYFPLDEFAADANNPASPNNNFGKQSLKLWCPPYGPIPTNVATGEWADDEGAPGEAGGSGSAERNMCTDLLAFGGPRSFDAVAAVVNKYPADATPLLHNYAFTMMGYNTFTYAETDTFLFSGDDDMWIFIDGKMVADLGGTHLPAEARVPMKDWATLWGWAPGSVHDLHFFYADRQTDGSNLMITTTLGKVGELRFGAPKIKRAERTSDGTILLYVTNQLSDASLAQMATGKVGSGYFPILSIKHISTDAGIISDTMGLAVESIKFNKKNADGYYVYEMTGNLYRTSDYTGDVYVPSTGDSLSFNFVSPVEGHKFMAGVPANITSIQNKPVEAFAWGSVEAAAASTKPAEFIDPPATVNRPDMNVSEFFGGTGTTASATTADGKGTMTINRIPTGGGASGDEIANKNMGEVILALLPSDDLTDAQMAALIKEGFGAPPARVGGASGAYIIDSTRTVSTDAGAFTYQQMVVGPTSDKDGLVVSRCSSVEGKDAYDNSCLGVSFVTDRPFSANIMVYDHLGNFVSRYAANVDDATFTKLQSKQKIGNGAGICPDLDASKQEAIKTGKVLATINVYPFSQTGRKLGTGIYLLKVDVMQKANHYCILADPNNKSSATDPAPIFSRAFNQIKLAYMRSK